MVERLTLTADLVALELIASVAPASRVVLALGFSWVAAALVALATATDEELADELA